MSIHAVIQAGGKGTRLRSLTHDKIPKPLLPLNGKPMIEWQINNLKRYDITSITIITGYLGEKIEEYFGDGSAFGVRVSYIRENDPLGSAGALFYVREETNADDILLIFGDVMCDVDFTRMISFHEDKHALATLLCHPNSHPYDSDILITDNEGRVNGFISKSTPHGNDYDNCVNAGIYLITKELLEKIKKPSMTDLERNLIFPEIDSGRIYAYRTPEYVKDAGTVDRFTTVSEDQKNGIWSLRNLSHSQRCIFLDRDGTINVYKGLITDSDQIELEKNAAEAIKMINRSGYLCIVITNQPVVARGLCSIDDVESINRRMIALLGNEGAYIDDIRFCPHHPDRGYPGENPAYKIDCKCRKPKTGMINEMADKYNIDLSRSWFIGDTTVDIQTGINAAMHTALVLTGETGKDGKYNVFADITADDLLDAVEKILI